MRLDLSGQQVKVFRDALTSAFPRYDDLAMLVRTELDARLTDIVAPGAMPKVAFELITWAESQGRLGELLEKALAANPTNPDLARFSRSLSDATGVGTPDILALPGRRWTAGLSSPAALLRAELGVVPFHGREQETNDLASWCASPGAVAVRLYTGVGGMGKTRLLLEMCTRLRVEGWAAGFVDPRRAPRAAEGWSSVCRSGRRIFAVLDYAENDGGELLDPLLEALAAEGSGAVGRVVLLARAAGEWWDQLRERRGAVGDLLAGPSCRWLPMRPLALDASARVFSYRQAQENFARELGRPVPEEGALDLDGPVYERVLLLHMRALAAIEGVPVKEENGILDYVLRRERRFWRERCAAVELDPVLVAGVAQAMAVLTLGGGAKTRGAAIEVLGQVPLLAGQSPAVLAAIAGVLHDALPGESGAWIEPLRPDLLGEHLIEHELGRPEHAGQLLNIVFGPADP